MGLSLGDPGHPQPPLGPLGGQHGGSHQPRWFFPLLRALEKMCPFELTLEAVPGQELLATEVEPAVPWL